MLFSDQSGSSRTYLGHHELESLVVINTIIIVIIIVTIIIITIIIIYYYWHENGSLQRQQLGATIRVHRHAQHTSE